MAASEISINDVVLCPGWDVQAQLGGNITRIRRRLRAWFARHQRPMPWRAKLNARARRATGAVRNPYFVWLSEMMLQQTQVATVLPYFERFTRRFADVQSLAAGELDEVLALWAGLGYYSRARNLHRAARIVMQEHQGRFPNTLDGLLALPGVGRYSAGAIRSIAFDQPAAIVDGNVIRVLSRLFAIPGDPRRPANLRRLWSLAETLADPRHPGDFNQAMMELGALVCTPANPACGATRPAGCPLRSVCRAFALGRAESFPPPRRRARVLAERWAVAVCRRGQAVLLCRRSETGRWGGLWEFPGLVVPVGESAEAAIRGLLRERFGARAIRLRPAGRVRHQLSHRDMSVEVFAIENAPNLPGGRWVSRDELATLAVSRLTQKIAQRAKE